MNTIKIFLAPSGATASIYKDFPLYQGSFQNKLLNVYVPTSILSPDFKTYDASNNTELDPFVAGNAVKIAIKTVARNGKYAYSKDYYMRYLKTLTKDGVEYALFERKLPQEFTFYEGQGALAPTLIINVITVEFGEIGDVTYTANFPNPSHGYMGTFDEEKFLEKVNPPAVTQDYVFSHIYATSYVTTYSYTATFQDKSVDPVLYGLNIQGSAQASDNNSVTVHVQATAPDIIQVTTSQSVKLDVLPSSNLDKDETVEATEWERVEATLNAILLALNDKQDKKDSGLETSDTTVVGAINEVNRGVKNNTKDITKNTADITKAQQDIADLEKRPAGTNYIGLMTVAENLPTDAELLAFVKSVKGAAYSLQNGDAVTVVVTKAEATDVVYFYKWNGTKWSYYPLPAVEPASNANLGLVKGDETFTDKNISVTIVNGVITAIRVLDDGQPIEVGTYLYNLDDLLKRVLSGEQTVGKAEQAEKDGLGQNIADTYMDKTIGASKNYVQDYALPKKFNENLYLQNTDDGFIYSSNIVDEQVTTIDASAFGYTTIYTADYALDETKFNLNAKNSINIVNTISLNAETYAAYVARVYVIGADGTETLLAAKQSSFETLPANTVKEMAFAMAFTELGKREITVGSGDKIRVQFVILKTSSQDVKVRLVSGGTNSSINLFVDSQTIAVVDGIQGKLAGEYASTAYTITDNVGTFAFPSTDLIDGCVYRLTSDKPTDTTAKRIAFSFGSKVYSVTTPTQTDDLQGLAACGQFENATGTAYAFLGLVQGDTIILLGDNLAELYSLAKTNEADIALNDADIEELKSGKLDKPTGNPSEVSVVQVAANGTTSYKAVADLNTVLIDSSLLGG